jgi:hypothetical protein
VVVGAQFEDSSSTGVNSAPDELASGSGAAYVFGIGELLESLGKTGYSTVGTDLAYGAPGFGAISVAGEVLFESSLLGAGSAGGRNKAMFSTVAGPVDIALQTGSIVSGLAGLPTGAKIATVTHAVHNRSASTGLFQATVTGTGIDATNNRLLFLDNGAFISPLLRSGQPIAELGGAVTTGFTDVLQDEAVSDRIALSYTLKARTGTAPVTTANDSGLLLMSHSGAIDLFNLREGADAFGRGGVFGQFGRAAMAEWKRPVFWKYFTEDAEDPSRPPLPDDDERAKALWGELGLGPKMVPLNGGEGWVGMMELTPAAPVIYTITEVGGQNQFIDPAGRGTTHLTDQVQMHAQNRFKRIDLAPDAVAVSRVSSVTLTYQP